jgi:uncharacterized protein
MAGIYRALDYQEEGQLEKARPEFLSAYRHQQDAEANNMRRIKKLRTGIEECLAAQTNAFVKAAVARVQKDPCFTECMATNYSELKSFSGYSDYMNPFAVYMDGVYFLCAGTGQSDLEPARKSFERVAAMTGTNRFLLRDLDAVGKAACGQAVAPTTFIVFETGCAPWREEIRFCFSLVMGRQNEKVSATAVFPVLRFDPSFVPSLAVAAGGASETTVTVASMDRIIARSFQDEKLSIPGVAPDSRARDFRIKLTEIRR